MLTKLVDTGVTPFFMATQKGNKEIVKMLLERGANPDLACTVIGYTPAMVAIHKQDIEITKLLIEKTDLDKNIWKGGNNRSIDRRRNKK